MAQQRFYEGQTLTLTLDTSDSDLASSTLKQIRTKDPNGLEASNTATITSTTKLNITIASGDIIKGLWTAHTYAEFSGSIVKKGRTFEFEVHEVYT